MGEQERPRHGGQHVQRPRGQRTRWQSHCECSEVKLTRNGLQSGKGGTGHAAVWVSVLNESQWAGQVRKHQAPSVSTHELPAPGGIPHCLVDSQKNLTPFTACCLQSGHRETRGGPSQQDWDPQMLTYAAGKVAKGQMFAAISSAHRRGTTWRRGAGEGDGHGYRNTAGQLNSTSLHDVQAGCGQGQKTPQPRIGVRGRRGQPIPALPH